jgi:cytochrome c oxidase accessory protein FixG
LTPAAPAPGSPQSHLGSMRADGSRVKVHPADVRGRWMTRRRLAFAVLMAFYVLSPLVPVGGHPMIQLDVAHRRFYLFGQTFNAQDFWMVVLLALSFVFGLLFVTAWRGRVWCGWACPQTVFLEGVYRPIERWLEGPRERRLKAAREPWTARGVDRTVAKHLLFLAVSLAIAHTAAALFVGPRELLAMIQHGPAEHRVAFGLTMGFTAILVFNFGWFREQFCVVLCPYGRLQSVLQDRDTVTVAYDAGRGEPRGKIAKGAPAGGGEFGDCVDCQRCVVVCPTAIDIRNGSQMECLACLQCVDACDEVMTRVKRPTGLIGLYSQRALGGGATRTLRARLAVYGALFLVTASALVAALALRTSFEANVLRPRGANPFVVDGDVVRNAFEVHLVNKAPQAADFRVSVESPVAAEVVLPTPEVHLASLADARVPISVAIERVDLASPVELVVVIEERASGESRRQTVRFLAPLGAVRRD